MMKFRISIAFTTAFLACFALSSPGWAQHDEHGGAATPAADAGHGAEPSHAADAAHGEEHGSPSLFSGDLGNAFWTVLIFVILLVALGKFAWPQILAGLQKREEFIRESLESAKRDREAAEARLKEYEAKILEARAQASAIVDEGRRDAEALKKKIEDTARHESEAMVQRAKRDIGLARDTAVKELYDKSADLAVQIASRLIRKDLDAKQHQQLISDAIASVNSAARN